MESDFIDIEILNWEKYNPRTDSKNHSWFRFENGLIESPQFYKWPGDHLKVFIYILSHASRKKSRFLTVDPEHPASAIKVGERSVRETLHKLSILGVIRIIALPCKSNFPAEKSNIEVTQSNIEVTFQMPVPTDDTNVTNVTNVTDGRTDGHESAAAFPKVHHPIIRVWNDHRGKLAGIRGCSASRQKHIGARWAENPSEAYWLEVVQRIAGSEFCSGKNDRGWKADFDFLLQPDTSFKVLEGKYDDRKGATLAGGSRNYATDREAGNRAALNEYLATLPKESA